ncbi:DNA repair protein RecO [Bacteroidia bacterium]|nr:DNA repair protein RecO [Bacteroidia bacterium]
MNYIKTRAIVLSTIKYGDNSVIVKMFLEKAGVQSFIVKGINKSKSKIAYFQPLSLLEIDYCDSKANLKYIKEQRFLYFYENIQNNFNKNCIFIFLAEVLRKSLLTAESEPDFFCFIYESLIDFDKKPNNFNDFHLHFLIKMMDFLGFLPTNENDFIPSSDKLSRHDLLENILGYYNYHILDFSPIKSHLILKDLLR